LCGCSWAIATVNERGIKLNLWGAPRGGKAVEHALRADCYLLVLAAACLRSVLGS
jgi:hypothetical protein